MASYLVYWKTYWEDEPNPSRRQRDPDWHTHRESFVNAIVPGDELWVVTQGGPEARDEWRLLERLVVVGRDPQRVESRYGQFRIIASPDRSQLFDPRAQADFSPLLRRLTFSTGKSIAAHGRLIGQSIQSPRSLSTTDLVLLSEYAATLPLRTNPQHVR